MLFTLTYLASSECFLAFIRLETKNQKTASSELAYFLYLSSVLIDVLFWNYSKYSSYSFMVLRPKNVPWSLRICCPGSWGIYVYVSQQNAVTPMKHGSRKCVAGGCLSSFYPCLLPTNVNFLPMQLCKKWVVLLYICGQKAKTPKTQCLTWIFCPVVVSMQGYENMEDMHRL